MNDSRSNFGLILFLSIILVVGIGALLARASGTTSTGTTVMEQESRTETVKRISWAFVSDVTETATFKTEFYYSGKVLGFASVIGAASPSDGWDLTVTDSHGIDILNGAGLNQIEGANKYIYDATLGVIANDRLVFSVTHAGASKAATATLWIR